MQKHVNVRSTHTRTSDASTRPHRSAAVALDSFKCFSIFARDERDRFAKSRSSFSSPSSARRA